MKRVILLALIGIPIFLLSLSKVSAYALFNNVFVYQRTGSDMVTSADSMYGWITNSADVDGDGKVEFLVGDRGASYSPTITNAGAIYIYDDPNDLTTYKTKIYAPLLSWYLSFQYIQTRDINNDGIQDIIMNSMNSSVVCNGCHPGAVHIFLGRTNWPHELDITQNDYKFEYDATKLTYGTVLLFADFDNDGDEDIGVGYKNAAKTAILIDVYDDLAKWQTYTVQQTVPFPAGASVSFGYAYEYGESRDINNDGKKDVLISDVSSGSSMYIFWGGKVMNTPDAIIRPEAASAGIGRIGNVAYGDLNGDGVDDMCLGAYNQDVGALVDAGKVYCMWGGPSLTTKLSGEVNIATIADVILEGKEARDNFGRGLVIKDFNYDEKKDLIIGGYEYSETSPNQYGYVAYYLNAGSGTFEEYKTVANSYANGLMLGVIPLTDVDGDGYLHTYVLTNINGYYPQTLFDFVLRHGLPHIQAANTATGSAKMYTVSGNASYQPITRNITDREALLILGAKGNWNARDTGYSPSVLKVDGQYKMWYSAKANSYEYRIGYATSSNGLNWTEYANQCGSQGAGCIFSLGVANSWDDAAVFAPSVIFDSSANLYKMWYTGFDGSKNRIGYATSLDGITWTRYDNPSVAACGFSEALDDGCVLNNGVTAGTWDQTHITHPRVFVEDGTYKMYYTGTKFSLGSLAYNDYPLSMKVWRGTDKFPMGLATSPDGITWTRYDDPGTAACGFTEALDNGCILDTGAWRDFDVEAIYASNIIKEGSTYAMWYTGVDGRSPNVQKITSTDGISWTKNGTTGIFDYHTNTGLEKDAGGIAVPYVLKDGSTYRMYYTGSDMTNFTLLYAFSTDGVTWTRPSQTYTESYSADIKGVQYKLGNGNWASCAAADGSFNSQNENYTCSIPNTTAEGSYDIKYRLVDTNDMYSPLSYSPSTQVTVDNTAPVKPIVTTLGKITNIPNRDSLYYYFTSQFAQIQGIAESNSTVHFKYGSKDFSAKANSSGNFLVTVMGLPRELVEFSYYAQDAAGNKSTSRILKLMIGEENFPAYLAESTATPSVTPTPTETVMPTSSPTQTPTPTLVLYDVQLTDQTGKVLRNTTVYINGQKYRTDSQGKLYVQESVAKSAGVSVEVNGKKYQGNILGNTIVAQLDKPVTTKANYSWLWWLLFILVLAVFAALRFRSKKK